MKAQKTIDTATQWLADDSNDHWEVPRLIGYLKQALYRIFSERPDLMLTDAGLVDATTVIENITDENSDIPDSLNEAHISPLSHLICYFAYTEDADSTANIELMKMHLSLYEKAIY